MKFKHLTPISLASLGLLLALATPVPAQMNHDEMTTESGQRANEFQRIEQPLWSRAAVTATGLSLVGLELWWFLLSKPKSRKATTTGGVQEITVTVDGGYEPSQIVVQVGQPVRLNFDRKDPSSCLEEVRFPDFRIARNLPVNQVTPIEFTPDKPGRYEFTCGMNMFRGTVEVVTAEVEAVAPTALATSEPARYHPTVEQAALSNSIPAAAEATVTPEGVQTATVTVAKGYQPNRVIVEAGQPVQLNFYRENPSGCYAQLLIPEFGIEVELPQGQTTAVEFTPTQPGEYEFMCGMKMNFGTIEVRSAATSLNGKVAVHIAV